MLFHLKTVNEGSTAPDCAGDMHGLGHLLEIRPLLQTLFGIGIDAV